MRRLFAGMAAALLAAVLFFPVSATSAESYVLMDAQTGRILEQRLPQKRALIASTTKIMTALVVCEQCNVLDRVCIPQEAVGIEGSSIYLKAGEVLTVQELLYGMMLHSGNDAATALAIYCGGTVEGFAELMNDKARNIGLLNTHFANPHGLDAPDHYSTAEDLAKLAAYAMENPIFEKTVSTKTVNISGRSLRNHNKLLWKIEGADGVKTGYTRAAGRILVSSAVRQGRRLICVTISDPNDWQDHEQLLERGFSRYSVCQAVTKGQTIITVEVVGGQNNTVDLVACEDFYYSLKEDEYLVIVPPQHTFVYAPVVEGACAGYASVCLDGKTIGRVPVAYKETVEQINVVKVPFWKRLWKGEAW